MKSLWVQIWEEEKDSCRDFAQKSLIFGMTRIAFTILHHN
jgi:hypothetical protein